MLDAHISIGETRSTLEYFRFHSAVSMNEKLERGEGQRYFEMGQQKQQKNANKRDHHH